MECRELTALALDARLSEASGLIDALQSAIGAAGELDRIKRPVREGETRYVERGRRSTRASYRGRLPRRSTSSEDDPWPTLRRIDLTSSPWTMRLTSSSLDSSRR